MHKYFERGEEGSVYLVRIGNKTLVSLTSRSLVASPPSPLPLSRLPHHTPSLFLFPHPFHQTNARVKWIGVRQSSQEIWKVWASRISLLNIVVNSKTLLLLFIIITTTSTATININTIQFFEVSLYSCGTLMYLYGYIYIYMCTSIQSCIRVHVLSIYINIYNYNTVYSHS